jgi:hypothetical protein
MNDRRAAFPDIYSIITRQVAENTELGRDRFFQEPQWISRLAGHFCERYLETLRWSLNGTRQDTGAWEIAYARCHDRSVPPIQNVLLGLSAHINYDLAIGLQQTMVEEGRYQDPAVLARYKHDHDAVNRLLRDSIPEALDHLIERHGCSITHGLRRHTFRITEWATMRILTTWRERVWFDALALLRAPSSLGARAVKLRMERTSARYARVLSIHIPRADNGRAFPGAAWLSRLTGLP